MEKQTAINIAAGYFEHYPDTKELFVTSDEQVFFNEGMAKAHAITLNPEEPVVVGVSRKEATAPAKETLTKEAALKAVEVAEGKVQKAKEAVEAADKKNNADAKVKAQENLKKAEEKLAEAKEALAELDGE